MYPLAPTFPRVTVQLPDPRSQESRVWKVLSSSIIPLFILYALLDGRKEGERVVIEEEDLPIMMAHDYRWMLRLWDRELEASLSYTVRLFQKTPKCILTGYSFSTPT